MDTSTIRCHISQEWSVDTDGGPTKLIAESAPQWTCTCGGSAYGEWSGVAAHLAAVHSPEAVAAGNGIPSDVTGVDTFHSVQLEGPND